MLSEQPKEHVLEDLQTIPQDLYYFADKSLGKKACPRLLSTSQATAQVERFRKRFFEPWSRTGADRKTFAYCTKTLSDAYEERGYAENLHRWTTARLDALARNADYERAPSLCRNAIITSNCALRLEPTNSPYFPDIHKEGQSYPFDLFQNSFLAFGTPVKVFHVSQQRDWYYIESAFVSGWVEAFSLAFVDDIVQKYWETSPRFVAIAKDDTPLTMHAPRAGKAENINSILSLREILRRAAGIAREEDLSLSAKASIGAIFPLERIDEELYVINIPFRNPYGDAKIVSVRLAHEQATELGVPLTASNMAKLAQPLLGSPYGWGGMYGHRDCSSLMQDIFTVFGIALPRNSKQQSLQGIVFSLENMTNDEKEAAILSRAIPFQSLIYMPGHIGLYVGEYDGKPVFLHNAWGLRLRGDKRFVIGKTVITTLSVGEELEERETSLLSRVRSFSILPPQND